MSKHLIYKLRIGAYQPDTIPMARLSEYMSDLAGLLGETNSVHFTALDEGSTVLKAVVDLEAIPKVTDRISSLAHGDASDDLIKHFQALDKRLSDDNAVGSLSAYTEDKTGGVVIEFPGCERPKPVNYGVIRERGALDGVPVSIGGRDRTVHVILQDGDKLHTGIDVSRELAIRLSDEKCLYRKTIRLHGLGRWQRSEEGEWKLLSFKADDFDVLEDTPLRETLMHLRSVPGSGWSDIEDPVDFLKNLREDPDERPH